MAKKKDFSTVSLIVNDVVYGLFLEDTVSVCYMTHRHPI